MSIRSLFFEFTISQYDKNQPEMRLEVDILVGDRRLATATAATFRRDLLAAGKGDGRHSFNVPTPSWLKDGRPHPIQVKVAGNGFYLSNSPTELCSLETICPRQLTLNLSQNSWSMCRILDSLLSSPDCLYLALVMRTDVPLHSDLQSHLNQTVNHILSHHRIGELVFETPSEMIKRVR